MERLAAALGEAERAEAAWRRCSFARLSGDRVTAALAGQAAIDLAAASGDARSGSIAHREMSMLFASEGVLSIARVHAHAASELASTLADDGALGIALAASAYIAGEAHQSLSSISQCERAVERFSRAGDRRREAQARTNIASQMVDLGRIDDASRQLEASLAASRQIGNHRAAAVCLHNLGVVKRLQGDLDGATDSLERAEDLAIRVGHARLRAAAATELA